MAHARVGFGKDEMSISNGDAADVNGMRVESRLTSAVGNDANASSKAAASITTNKMKNMKNMEMMQVLGFNPSITPSLGLIEPK